MGLLLATAAAFAITEHLKLVKAPISGTQVSKYLAPGCACETSKATVSVKLRHSDVVTARILDHANRPVATLVTNQPEPKGRVELIWHGRTDAGGVAPDGRYHAELHLANAHWTILLPNPINLDTRPPLVRSVTARPPIFSPGSSGAGNHLTIRYRLSEHAHLKVWKGSRVLLRTRSAKPTDKTSWKGKIGGKALAAGTYTLTVGAIDLAGNVTPQAQRKQLVVVVRYVTLGRRRILARAGARFSVHVHAAEAYTWTFDHRHGKSRRPVLRLRAPAQSGRYRLVVTASGQRSTALVVAR